MQQRLAKPVRPARVGKLVNLFATLSLLAVLAACTTAPPSPSSANNPRQAPPRITTLEKPLPVPATPASPEAAGTPAETALELPSSDAPRPALLAGEPARQFERGGASWYGPGFHGRRTASGERYDMNALTAAHRTLPFGTMVRVHSLVNGREVDVRITDRGPFSRDRVIDVSRAAAEALDMLGQGFKEVVLLVPDSTPVMDAPQRSRVIKRPTNPH